MLRLNVSWIGFASGMNETGVYFRRFEPAEKTGPDAMEYRRLQLMMKCSSAEEISCVQSACLLLPPRFIRCCSNFTILQKACMRVDCSSFGGINCTLSDATQLGKQHATFMNSRQTTNVYLMNLFDYCLVNRARCDAST
jgi:hypothetical protein